MATEKTLYLIGGPMGVGKTAAASRLHHAIPARSVFLDGDWCWMADPFTVTEETKAMVLDNICHLLRNFLRCTAYDTVIFCWVMQEASILRAIFEMLESLPAEISVKVLPVSLVCREEVLRERLSGDIAAGRRRPDCIPRAVAYLPLYAALDTVKLDVSDLTVEETVEALRKIEKKFPDAPF